MGLAVIVTRYSCLSTFIYIYIYIYLYLCCTTAVLYLNFMNFIFHFSAWSFWSTFTWCWTCLSLKQYTVTKTFGNVIWRLVLISMFLVSEWNWHDAPVGWWSWRPEISSVGRLQQNYITGLRCVSGVCWSRIEVRTDMYHCRLGMCFTPTDTVWLSAALM